MAKAPDAFQGMKDLWGFHKEVHEDDWNDGQQVTLKVKNSSSTAVSIKLFKIFTFSLNFGISSKKINFSNHSENLFFIFLELRHYFQIWTPSY